MVYFMQQRIATAIDGKDLKLEGAYQTYVAGALSAVVQAEPFL
jgi:hypothetical protein